MLWTIIGFVVLGLVAGLIARFLVPGPDPMGLLGTILLGIAGSFTGGFLGNFFFGGGELALTSSSLVGSIAGAIVLLILMRLFGLRGNQE